MANIHFEKTVMSVVPQGSILNPFLFLIYINDLSDNLHCNLTFFADDASLFSTIRKAETKVSTSTMILQK